MPPRKQRSTEEEETIQAPGTPTKATQAPATEGAIQADALPMTPKNMRVVELREALSARGLSPKGLKKELVERLEGFMDRKVAPTPLQQETRVKSPTRRPQRHTDEENDRVDFTMDAEEVVEAKILVKEGQETFVIGPDNNIVHISNFVRPFTVPAVKDLVSQFGRMTEFWMDHLRTNCYVHYETPTAAGECLRRLEGLKWPFETGKCLKVTLSNSDDMKLAILNDNQPRIEPSDTDRVDEPIFLDKLFMKTETTPHLYFLPVQSLE